MGRHEQSSWPNLGRMLRLRRPSLCPRLPVRGVRPIATSKVNPVPKLSLVQGPIGSYGDGIEIKVDSAGIRFVNAGVNSDISSRTHARRIFVLAASDFSGSEVAGVDRHPHSGLSRAWGRLRGTPLPSANTDFDARITLHLQFKLRTETIVLEGPMREVIEVQDSLRSVKTVRAAQGPDTPS